MKNFSKSFTLNLLITLLISSSISASAFSTNPTPENEKDPMTYIVYFEGDMEEALNSDDSYMKTFIEVYNLEVLETFELDHDIKGFILVAPKDKYVPSELAKEISLIKDVFMVELEKLERLHLES
jgi:hypothetical protein